MMQGYAEYKDSGVDWLGEIPAGWELTKLGSCLTPFSEKNHADLPLLSITRELGVIERDVENQDTNHNYIPDDLSGYKLLKKGQFGMNKMKAWQGSYGVSPFTGIVSPAYFMFDFTKEIDPGFFHVTIRSKLYVSFFGSASDGVRIGQWDLSKTRMKEIPLALPPLPEQTAIAKFLDEKTARIDELVEIKRRQIALLGERKQILIQNAVTKGLNPDAPMKDSGVDWIGQIPAHWEVYRLKNISYVQTGITLGKTYSGRRLVTLPYLRVANVQAGFFALDDIAEISLPPKEVSKYTIRKNDILITEGGDIDKLGRGTVWEGKIENCLHQNHVFAVRINNIHAVPHLVSLCMESHYGRQYFTTTANKTTNLASTNSTKLGNFPLSLPSLEEQTEIIEYCASESQKIDDAITIKQNQITKLNEYKITLINAAVTGKIKVA